MLNHKIKVIEDYNSDHVSHSLEPKIKCTTEDYVSNFIQYMPCFVGSFISHTSFIIAIVIILSNRGLNQNL